MSKRSHYDQTLQIDRSMVSNEMSESEEQVGANWHVMRGSSDMGKMHENSVRKLLNQKSDDSDLRIRQGDGSWYSARDIRTLFRQLDARGYFVKQDSAMRGPYLGRKLIELFDKRVFNAELALVKLGRDGVWDHYGSLEKEDLLRHTIWPVNQSSSFTDGGVIHSEAEGSLEAFDFSDFTKSDLESLRLSLDEKTQSEINIAETHYLNDPKRLLSSPSVNRRKKRNRPTAQDPNKFFDSTELDSGDGSRGDDAMIASGGVSRRSDQKMTSHASREEPTAGVDGTLCSPSVVTDDPPKRGKRKTGGRRGLICLDCGKQINHKTGNCDHCNKFGPDREDVSGRKPANVMGSEQGSLLLFGFEFGQLGRVSALILAVTVSGVFLARGVVSAILWRSMHSANQQLFGWLALVVGATLVFVAWLSARTEFQEAEYRRLHKIGCAVTLVVSLIAYFITTDEIRSAEADLRKQTLIWTQMMENGGYGEISASESVPEVNLDPVNLESSYRRYPDSTDGDNGVK